MTGCQFQFCSVSKVYDEPAVLSDVSFTVTAGEHTAILGPSGRGKSTVLRLLAGLEAPSAGEILCDGKAISDLKPHLDASPPAGRCDGLPKSGPPAEPLHVGQRPPGPRGYDAVAARGEEAGGGSAGFVWHPTTVRPEAGDALRGQQQRVALARAIAAQAGFLLLDEPFSGLDLVHQDQAPPRNR